MHLQLKQYSILLLLGVLFTLAFSLPSPHVPLSDPQFEPGFNSSLPYPLLESESEAPAESSAGIRGNGSSAIEEQLCTAATRAQQQQDSCFKDLVTSVVFEVMSTHFSASLPSIPNNESVADAADSQSALAANEPEIVTAPLSPSVSLFANGSTSGKLAIARTNLFLGFEILAASAQANESSADAQQAVIRAWLMGASDPSCEGETSFTVTLEPPDANATSNQTFVLTESAQWMLTAQALEWALSSNCTELVALSKENNHSAALPDTQTEHTLTDAPATTMAPPPATPTFKRRRDSETAPPADPLTLWFGRLQELFDIVDQCRRAPACFCNRISGRRPLSNNNERPSNNSESGPSADATVVNQSSEMIEREIAARNEGMMSGDRGERSARSAPEARRLDILDESTSAEDDEGIQCPRGPAGPRGDPGAPGKPGPDGANAPFRTRVAFFAALPTNKDMPLGVEVAGNYSFSDIIINIGDAYNATTGRFTAPVDGVYKFTVTIAAEGQKRAAVDLVRENDRVFRVWSESIPLWETASNTAILEMTANSQVWLMTAVSEKVERWRFHGHRYSTFSGHILFENFAPAAED